LDSIHKQVARCAPRKNKSGGCHLTTQSGGVVMNVDNILQAASFILWLLIVGLIVIAVTRASRGRPMRGLGMAILVLAVFAVVLTVVAAGLVFVQPNERGVVISALTNGVRPLPLQPGLNWVVPFFENVKPYPISRQTYTMSIASLEGRREGDDSISARTLDGQEVLIDASVIYSINPEQVVNVHIDWQDRYSEDLVRPQTRGVIRDAVSQFGVEEVVSTKRSEMTAIINEKLAEKLNDNGLKLVDFVLRNITFSPEYAASVEQKQIAEQLAQQARFVVEQRRQEAEQARQQAQGIADAVVIRAKGAAEARLIEAEAENKALDLINQAVRNNADLLTYLYINKISPNIDVMLLPNNASFLFPLPTLTPGGAIIEPEPQPSTAPEEP
jgi:regulator of protease activity HflC (stomatin/prohibitin superfamily)